MPLQTQSRIGINWEIHLSSELSRAVCGSVLAGADPEEELRVRVFLHGYGCHDPVKQHLSNKLELPDPAMLSSVQEPELECPPSPYYKGFSSGTAQLM